MTAKPTVSGLGIDLAAQVWHQSGRGDGAIEVAFVRASGTGSAACAPPPPGGGGSGLACTIDGS